MEEFSIHPETHVGSVHLTVPDLERSLRFYLKTLGFDLLEREQGRALLGAGKTPLVGLTEQPDARPRQRSTTGLYHLAILLPSRRELARTLHHLIEMGSPPEGAADHLVSEALYLSDPDANGIEISADRPRREWPRHDGQVQMATNPLDLQQLLSEADTSPWKGLPPRTRIGHVHLQVSDLRRAEAFYHQILGFDLTQRYGPSAVFLSAGGYHHHVGLNTWAGVGALQPPADAAGLRYFTLCLPNWAELERIAERLTAAGVAPEQREDGLFLRDPSGNGVLLTPQCGKI